jgi:hypothetical protein
MATRSVIFGNSMPIPACSLVTNGIEIANMSLFGRLRKLDCKIESFRRKIAELIGKIRNLIRGDAKAMFEAKRFPP